jgi:hypothetical protein
METVMSSGRDMFRFLRKAIANFAGEAKHKADAFHIGAKLISMSDSAWEAQRALGADGSHLFFGIAGDVIIIAPDGRMYQGKLQHGAVEWTANGFAPEYSRLKAFEE